MQLINAALASLILATPLSADPFAQVSEEDRNSPPETSIRLENGRICTFAFDSWELYEAWNSFFQYSFNISTLPDYRPEIVKNLDFEKGMCLASRADYIRFTFYDGRESESEKFIFQARVGGELVEYRINLSSDYDGNAIETATWRRTDRTPSASTSYASRSDYYNACLGSTDYDTNCYLVEDPDLKNLCLGRSERDDTWCYGIDDPDLKNLCLGISTPDYDTFCYSISDEDIKNTCLAGSNYDYREFCYSIDREPWRSFCGGIALSSNNCYNFN